MALIDKLTGTKFLFNKELISYPDLVKLLQDTGFTTKFIQKPITDNLEVHSLYIKPELEIAYLAQSANADKYYETAGYSCVAFEEFELQDVLDILGYKAPIKTIKTINDIKKLKYITIENDSIINTFKKKDILHISYYKDSNILKIHASTGDYGVNLSSSEYADFISELNS